MSGRRRALVVICHPVAESLIGAAGRVTVDALGRAGHEVEVIDLYGEGFDPVLDLAGWRAHHAPHDDTSAPARHVDLLRWCDTLVLVHPTWFGAPPAMLKGWFDRVFDNGVAYSRRPGQKGFRSHLRHIRHLWVVTTYGSGRVVNTIQGEPGRRFVRRALRSLCHLRCRTRRVALYKVDRIGRDRCAAWLTEVERWMLER